MPSRLDEIIETFASIDDDELRLELLLDYAKKLPPLPEQYRDQRDLNLHRVPECMSPVYLWFEHENGSMRIHVEVAEEAPTVKGFISILVHAFNGAAFQEIQSTPTDLLHRLRLNNVIRMNRAIGLSAILGRIKKAAAAEQVNLTAQPGAGS